MNYPKTVLQQFFENQGIKQKVIAERLGTRLTYVSDLMRYRVKFGRSTAKKWADEFGLSEEWLMYRTGSMVKNDELLQYVPKREENNGNSIEQTVSASSNVNNVQDNSGSVEIKNADGNTLELLKSSISMNRSMMQTMMELVASQRKATDRMLSLYEELLDTQRKHSVASREYIAENVSEVKKLRKEVFEKVDQLGELIDNGFEKSTSKIVDKCKTFDFVEYNAHLKKDA